MLDRYNVLVHIFYNKSVDKKLSTQEAHLVRWRLVIFNKESENSVAVLLRHSLKSAFKIIEIFLQ